LVIAANGSQFSICHVGRVSLCCDMTDEENVVFGCFWLFLDRTIEQTDHLKWWKFLRLYSYTVCIEWICLSAKSTDVRQRSFAIYGSVQQ